MLFTFSLRRLVGRGGRGVAAPHFSPPPRPFERWTLLVLRFRWPILACWLAVLAGGVYASLLLPSQLATSFAVPGTDSERAGSVLARDFGERPEGTFTVVFHVRHSSDKQLQGRLRRRLERGARVLPGGRLGTFRAGGSVIYGELETRLGLQQAEGYTEPLRRALQSRDGPTALVLTRQKLGFIDRTKFGLDWNAPLPKGGFALANDVRLLVELELASLSMKYRSCETKTTDCWTRFR